MTFFTAPIAPGLVDRKILLGGFMSMRVYKSVLITLLPLESGFTRPLPFTFVKS